MDFRGILHFYMTEDPKCWIVKRRRKKESEFRRVQQEHENFEDLHRFDGTHLCYQDKSRGRPLWWEQPLSVNPFWVLSYCVFIILNAQLRVAIFAPPSSFIRYGLIRMTSRLY